MSVNKVDKTTGELVTLANGTRMWIGTKTAHDLAVQQGTMPNNCMVCITDDYKNTMIGEMKIWCGPSTSVPNGWLYCDGSAISRTTYADLFDVIGTAFGSGDGSTTFNIPDMRESVPKGAGLTGHTVGAHLDADGLAVGEFLDDRIQEHQHKLGSNDGTVDGYWATNQDGSSLTSSDLRVGGSTADNPRIYAKNIISGRAGATTEVKSVGVNFIICYE
jgi:microcystin-dependent protein